MFGSVWFWAGLGLLALFLLAVFGALFLVQANQYDDDDDYGLGV